MSELQAVLFDLDDTLIGFDDVAYNVMMLEVCSSLATAYAVDAQMLHSEHWRLSVARWRAAAPVLRSRSGAADGALIMLDIWQEALDAVGCSHPEAARAGYDGYWQGRERINYLYEETIEVLDALHGRVPMAVITNGPQDMQLDKLATMGLDRYFEVIVASGGHGIAKPDPAIFHLALDKLGAEPARSWHVGDNLHADVGGALATGLNAAWINRNAASRGPEHPQPHAEMANLRDLLKLVGLAP